MRKVKVVEGREWLMKGMYREAQRQGRSKGEGEGKGQEREKETCGC